MKINKDILIEDTGITIGDIIVEKGSNENGNYIKYSNGVMICWYTQTISGAYTSFTENYGALYHSLQLPVWNYPIEFIDTPEYVNAALQSTGIGGATISNGNATKPTKSKAGCWPWNATSWSGATCYIKWIAIGYWK